MAQVKLQPAAMLLALLRVILLHLTNQEAA